MIGWLRAVLTGILGGLCVAWLLTSTSGDLDGLVAFDVPRVLQIPGLILIGLLIGIAVPVIGEGAVAYATALLVAATVHVMLYAVPGLNMANYTNARFNNGFSTSLFVLMFGGIFLMIGHGAAIGLNVYARGLYD
ncbi:MAG TPA: hypothetical protein VKZ96_12070 [Thermomicrobiales bacterium]|nr:hypothetical protein [Thermomicrobiales bacterium]